MNAGKQRYALLVRHTRGFLLSSWKPVVYTYAFSTDQAKHFLGRRLGRRHLEARLKDGTYKLKLDPPRR